MLEEPEALGPLGPGSYNTDAGNKMSLTTSMERSPHHYSIMRSHTPRFPNSEGNKTPFAAYNIDMGRKKTVESCCRDTRRFYAASFDSAVPRFQRPWTSPATDAFYDADRTMSFMPGSVGKNIETTTQVYSILRSKYKRFPDKPIITCGADVVYDIDRGTKMGMAKAVLESGRNFKVMSTSSTRSRGTTKPDSQLGPGAYDFPYYKDVPASPYLKQRPLSSFASTAPRLNDKVDPYRGLGSTWRSEKDAKNWNRRGVTISKAEYLRPSYLPKSYSEPSSPKKATTKP